MQERTLIIAEAGVNHNGSLDMALMLIDAAKAAGADAVKFQSFKAERLVSGTAEKADYQKRATNAEESQFDMLKRLELSENDHLELIKRCNSAGIAFLSSPFDEESADMLDRMNISMFKIGSGEITNIPFLIHVARKGKPIILSTGMSTLDEVRDAVDAINGAGCERLTLLHCVTEYPAPYAEINLRAMHTLRSAFGVPVGYSDHTEGIEIALAAVALGASVIEKHFTYDRNLAGPDHRSSLEPMELQSMIKAIRHIELSLGDGVKRPASCEIANMAVARKSVVAARRIEEGTLITAEDLVVKRPGTGIAPIDIKNVIGRVATAGIEADEVLTWEKLQ